VALAGSEAGAAGAGRLSRQGDLDVKIRKNDEVQVIAGKDLGRKGKVHSVDVDGQRVVVAGVNMIKRHQKSTKVRTQAGIIEREAPINISNVMLVCGKCGKPTRVGHTKLADGSKTRVCRKCGEVVEK
jgi:large subunit ribosomal protein L24